MTNLFAYPPIFDEFGLTTGSSAALQFQDKPAQLICFKARSTNIGSFFIGDYSNRCYWELDAGQETDWIQTDNLNHYWHSNPSGTVDKLSWWIKK